MKLIKELWVNPRIREGEIKLSFMDLHYNLYIDSFLFFQSKFELKKFYLTLLRSLRIIPRLAGRIEEKEMKAYYDGFGAKVLIYQSDFDYFEAKRKNFHPSTFLSYLKILSDYKNKLIPLIVLIIQFNGGFVAIFSINHLLGDSIILKKLFETLSSIYHFNKAKKIIELEEQLNTKTFSIIKPIIYDIRISQQIDTEIFLFNISQNKIETLLSTYNYKITIHDALIILIVKARFNDFDMIEIEFVKNLRPILNYDINSLGNCIQLIEFKTTLKDLEFNLIQNKNKNVSLYLNLLKLMKPGSPHKYENRLCFSDGSRLNILKDMDFGFGKIEGFFVYLSNYSTYFYPAIEPDTGVNFSIHLTKKDQPKFFKEMMMWSTWSSCV